MKTLKNEFKTGKQPQPKGQFAPTDKHIMGEDIGRDATERLKRNPPVFEDAKIEFYNPGIKWGLSLFKF